MNIINQGIVVPSFADLPVRFSHLKAYGRSALHGYHARVTEMKQTAAMQRGTAFDALIFGTRKVCAYEGKRDIRTKAYQEFVAEHPDTEILTVSEFDNVRRMADALLNCEYAKPWMKGTTQQTLHFEYAGLQCRATPDWRGDGFVCDLKSARSSSDYDFPWQARRLGYPVQLWMQGIACNENGHSVSRYLNIAVESAAPWPVTVFELTARAQDKAARQLCLWAERLKVCEQSGNFPAYSQAIVPLDEPEEPELVYGSGDEEPDEDGVFRDVTMAG